MVGQGAQNYERTPDLLRGWTAVGEGSEIFEKGTCDNSKTTLFRE